MSKIPQRIWNAYRNCQRLFWEKKLFWTFFGNFDFEISRFCHSDTLKNEIPWTLTNDKIFFSSRTVPKKFFLTYYKHRPFNRTNSQGHTTSRKVATSLFRKKSSATWGPKITAFIWDFKKNFLKTHYLAISIAERSSSWSVKELCINTIFFSEFDLKIVLP